MTAPQRNLMREATGRAQRRARTAANAALAAHAGRTRPLPEPAVSMIASLSPFSRPGAGGAGGYDAARVNPLRSRSGRTGSGDFWVTRRTRESLRDYSREVFRNNAEYRRVVRALVTAAIGSGLIAQAATADPAWNDRAEALWKAWGEGRCESTGEWDMSVVQRGVLEEAVVPGDILPVFRSDGVLHIVESELLGDPAAPTSRTVTGADGAEVSRVVDGVEIDLATDARTAFFVGRYDEHGSVSFDKPTRVEASRAFLFRLPGRFSQTRGVPYLAHCMDRVEDLAEYVSWTIIAAKIHATMAFVVKTADPYATAEDFLTDAEDDQVDALAGIPGSPSRTLRNLYGDRQRLAPGEIWYLQPGEEVTTVGSNTPNSTFEPFVRTVLRSIAYGADMPPEVVWFDFKGTNLASVKAAMALSDAEMEPIRAVMRRFLRRVWAWKVAGWVRAGALEYRPDMLRVEWVTPALTGFDDLNQNKADEIAQKALQETDKRIAARRGYPDLRKFYAQLKAEQDLRGEFRLKRVLDPGAQHGDDPEAADDQGASAKDPSDDTGAPGEGATRPSGA